MSEGRGDCSQINSVLQRTIRKTILALQLDPQRKGELQKALSHLQDISSVYGQKDEELYGKTVNKIAQIALTAFEAQTLLSALIGSYFKRLPLFREAFQISVLRSGDQKYRHLVVQEPSIRISVPIPYHCGPLAQAKHLPDREAYEFDEGTQEQFS